MQCVLFSAGVYTKRHCCHWTCFGGSSYFTKITTGRTVKPTFGNQSIKNLSEQMQKHCSHCTTIWRKTVILCAGKWQWKKVSFTFMSTVSLVTSLLTEDCSRFLPTVWWRVCGTARSADDAERKRRRLGRSATCCRLSVRYFGARPFRHRNASTASFNDIRSGADGEVEASKEHLKAMQLTKVRINKLSERAFSFSGPVAWNSLPADIRCTTNRQTFKTLLKSHFFRQAFDIS